MNQQWYYGTKDNQQRGPVDKAVIIEKLRNNELTRDSLVWCEGMEQWQRIWTLMAELEVPSASSVNHTPVKPQTNSSTDFITHSASKPNNVHNSYNNENTSVASPYAAPASQLNSNAIVRGEEVIYAGFWRRAAACLIDGVLVGTVTQLLSLYIIFVAFKMMGIYVNSNPDDFSIGYVIISLLSFLIPLGLSATYYAWFHSSKAATLGKMLVGIKVVRPDGKHITFLRGIGRFFATYISSMIMFMGYIMAAFTDRKQALHDMMCDTWVVDKWAFTQDPQLQKRGLDTATIVILSIFGILFFVTFIIIIIAFVAAISGQ